MASAVRRTLRRAARAPSDFPRRAGSPRARVREIWPPAAPAVPTGRCKGVAPDGASMGACAKGLLVGWLQGWAGRTPANFPRGIRILQWCGLVPSPCIATAPHLYPASMQGGGWALRGHAPACTKVVGMGGDGSHTHGMVQRGRGGRQSCSCRHLGMLGHPPQLISVLTQKQQRHPPAASTPHVCKPNHATNRHPMMH